MWIGLAAPAAILRLGMGFELGGSGHIEGVSGRVLGDRVVDRR